MIAGTLEIQMAANMARLADDMAKSKAVVGDAMKGIESAVASAKAALGALGIGLGVGYFVSLVRGSIDAAEHLADLSKTTSIAVETLSGLKVAAKQSGGDLDSIAKSINKLTVEMGQSPEKFRALGVSAKDPLEAFKQLADIFTKLEDPQQRAAVMAAALGKSWAGAAPLLAEGGKKIGEMVERGSRFSGVTEDMARQADELNDKLVLIVGTGGLLTRVIGPLLPLFNQLADEMLKTQQQSKGLQDSWSPFVEILKVLIVLGAEVKFIFQTFGKDIARAIENVQLIAKGDFAGSRALGELFRKDAATAREALDAYTKTIMSMGTKGPAAEPASSPGGAAAADAAARAARFLGKEDSAKDAEKREQQIRDILHAVRVTDDQREIAQVVLQSDEKLKAEQDFVLQRLQLEEMLQDEIDSIQRESALGRQAFEKQKREDEIAGALSFTSDLASLMNTQSRKAFELGKLASIANALIKGYEAAVSSYAAGAKIGGPPLGAAFAAASILATTNLINNIRRQTFGGGAGGGGSAGGAPVATTQGASNFTSQQQPQGAQIVLNLNVNGNILDTQEFTDTILVPALKDAIANRDVTIIPQGSRQALDLAAQS